MIDLETLSTNPNAVILTIGGVKFDPYTSVIPSQGMYFKVDVDSQTAMGREVMDETLEWWSRQDKEIKDEAMGDNDRITLEEMIKKINKKVRKLGLIQILSQKNKINSLYVVEDFKEEIKKTKILNQFLIKNKLINSLIISDKNSKSNIIKSTRNIPNLKIIDQAGANAYDILKYKNIVFTTSSIKSFQDRISK